MPTYLIQHKETKEEKEVFMSYGTLQEYLGHNPEWHQIHKSSHIVSESGDVFSKTPDSWREHMKRIKGGSGRSTTIKGY